MIRLSLLITLTLLVVLGLPACSGDSGPVSPSPSPSSLGAVVAHTPTATAISTPDSGEYQVDAVEVQLGSGRELATAQFKVTVTRVSGQKDNPAPILMSTNGKEPLEMREISGMVAGDQETYTFTEILSKGSHQVVISVGDSDKSVVLTVPRPPIGTPAVAAIGQPIATATPKLPPILRIAPTKQPLVPKPTLPTPTPTPNFNLLVKPSLPSPTPTVEIIRPVIRTPDKLKLRLALPSPTPTIEIVRPIISTPVPLTLVPRKITPTPLPQPTILLPTPTPQIVPVMAPQPDTSQSLMSKQQYAEFCGELFFSLPTESFQRFIATGGKDEEAKGHFSE